MIVKIFFLLFTIFFYCYYCTFYITILLYLRFTSNIKSVKVFFKILPDFSKLDYRLKLR